MLLFLAFKTPAFSVYEIDPWGVITMKCSKKPVVVLYNSQVLLYLICFRITLIHLVAAVMAPAKVEGVVRPTKRNRPTIPTITT